MIIGQIMNKSVVYVQKDDTVETAAKLLQQNNIGSIPVVDKERTVKGIVTDRDIVTRCVANEDDPRTAKVGDIMTRGVFTITDDVEVSAAAYIMAERQIRRLPVLRDNKLVGMLSLGDLAKSPGCNTDASGALTEISDNRKPFA